MSEFYLLSYYCTAIVIIHDVGLIGMLLNYLNDYEIIMAMVSL
ncbi:hypothetical protein [Methanobrevibacter sp.]|nr:hypothetical protein [Methanobrevibacter sp.]